MNTKYNYLVLAIIAWSVAMIGLYIAGSNKSIGNIIVLTGIAIGLFAVIKGNYIFFKKFKKDE